MGEMRLREQLRDHDEWPSQAPGADTAVRVDAEDLRDALSALDAARAEIERLRTAAADERADVVAWMRAWGVTLDAFEGGCEMRERADEIERGAHVGAAKGGERG